MAVVKDGAGVGRAMLLPAKSSVIGTMQYLLPKGNVLPEYLYYVIRHMHLEKYFSGATIPHIYFRDYKTETFNLEPITCQAEIVTVLHCAEAIISARQQQLQKLDELVKARFVELFGTLHNNGNGFDVVTIADVCSLIKDGTHQTPQYTDNKETGYKFLSSKDVMSQKIDWTDIKYIPAELHEKLYATIKPQRNDILMSKNGVNYGIAAVNDIGVPNLHLGEIKKTKIFLPPMELQKEFVSFVEQTDKSKAAVQKALDEAQMLFDSLMQKYFG